MREELIALLGEKVGLDPSKAESVVDAILNFIKENPERLTAFLGDDPAEMITSTLGKLFNR